MAGVCRADGRDGRAAHAGEVVESALAAGAAHGVFTGGIERVFLAAAAVFDGGEAIYIAGGEGDDAAAAVALAHDAWQPRVQASGERIIARGSEIVASPVENISRGREVSDGICNQQVTGGGLKSKPSEISLRT